jgi:hypothetical protein
LSEETAIVFSFVIAVTGAVTLIIASMNNKRRLKEMHHRERIAMIQAGLMPSPELDPAGFESAAGLGRRSGGRGERYRTAGVAMIGLGLGLLVLIGGAFEQISIGIGVGGAWVMLGGALLANYFLMRGESVTEPPPSWTPPKPRTPEPPQNIAP